MSRLIILTAAYNKFIPEKNDMYMVNRKIRPVGTISSEIPFIEPRVIRHENKLPVYYLEGGTEEITKVEFVFNAGSFYRLKPLVAAATSKLLRSGTKSRMRNEINELFDFYSAHIFAEAQKDIVSQGMYVVNKYVEPSLKLFGEIIKEPVFPDEELDVFCRNQKQMHLINQKKVQHLAKDYFNELIYGEHHPYGYRIKTDDYDTLERNDLLDFHRSYYSPENSFCIVSGRLPADASKMIAEVFGSWKAVERASPKPPVYRMMSPGSRKMSLSMPGAVQTAVRIGKQLVNKTHPAYHRIKITNALLGGFFGSRLMQNIRQDKGYTYGINSNLVSLLRSGYFFISTQVGNDVCEAAIDEIYNELKRLRNVPADKHELETLKNYLYGNHMRSFDGPFAQAGRLKELQAFGLDISHHHDFLAELKNITAEDIMETAGLYLREEDMMEVVVGKNG